MTFEPGEEYDCDFCADVHEVRRGKGMAIEGFTPRVSGAVYARCPVVGVVDLSDGDPDPVEAAGASDDWP